MPAISLPRLKKQIAALIAYQDQPEEFWKTLEALLDFYTNRTARALPRPGDYLPTRHTPRQVLREIETSLAPLANEAPQRLMQIILRLWKENLLEAHLLAARLLGRLDPAEDNWLDIVAAWLNATRDPRIRQTLLAETLQPLRTHYTEKFFALLRNWLKGDTPSASWIHALTALKIHLDEASDASLPAAFNLLEIVLPAAAPPIQPLLGEILNQLYAQSPPEARYFLQQVIPQVTDPVAQRTLRRIIPSLHPEIGAFLRHLLTEKSAEE